MLSALAYVAVAAIMGADVVRSIESAIAHDPGDPLLTTAILAWNATHVPWTTAWWQFPIFAPAADALAFSEHLLGVSAIAAPIQWVSRSPVAAYNITLLLTYPLSGLAMYALVHRLTASAPAAFLAGLAYACAPVRVSQLPHIQLLVLCYTPLALLGLHAFVEDGRRRWLALFGAAWALQSAASGYLLIYGSVLVAFWTIWFVVARRRWRDLYAIAAAGVVAALPLAPLLYRYATVHARYGFTRQFGEAAAYGADITSLLCAPPLLTFWGWLRIGCKPEGESFPGAALVVLCVVAGAIARAGRSGAARGRVTQGRASDERVASSPGLVGRGIRRTSARWIRRLRAGLFAASAAFAAIALSAVVIGDWRLAAGPLRASVSGAMKPFSSAVYLLLGALLLSPRLAAAAQRSSVRIFYLLAAIGAWVLSWGPEPSAGGTQVLYQAPFAWLMRLPGGDAVRVPGRFWIIAMTCLVVLMGVLAADLLKRPRPRTRAIVVALAAAGLAMDGWARIPVRALPAPAPRPDLLQGEIVLELPLGTTGGDIAAVYRAVVGGWRAVNGFSGYEPAWYDDRRGASLAASPDVLAPVAGVAPGYVLVSERATDLQRMMARVPGAELVARGGGLLQYRLRRGVLNK